MYTISHYPDIEWWLGRGRPLNPYLRGLMIDYLRSVMKPKDLRLAPDEAFLTSGVKDFPEWSLVRRWVQGWLRYVHWYAGTASSPDVTLKAFFDAPVVQTDWKIKRSDEELVRFGHLWKLWDMVVE